MSSLHPEVKKVWCEALRSGEFKQGKGKLKNKGKYCCLGVLKAVQVGIDGKDNEALSLESLELIGLNETQELHLINMNDGDPGSSFDEIADYIEKKL